MTLSVLDESAAATGPIFSVDKWSVNEMVLSHEKVGILWQMLQRYRTLFSDLTRADQNNFVRVITLPGSMWFEVRERDTIVGIIWFGDMDQMVDCTAHMMFFDRQPAEKVGVCRGMVKWMFGNFPLHRITVTVPTIYHATIRLLERIGMKYEGRKREAALMGGKWNDMMIYGITRSESEEM